MQWMSEARDVFGELIICLDEKRLTSGTESRAKSVGTQVHHHFVNAWYDRDLGSMIRACESDWVFIMDYDEQLSPEWRQNSWQRILERNEFTHFWCPRRHVVPGGPYWPDYQLRLIRTGVAGTTFPSKLHECIYIPGDGAHLQHLALHHHNLWLLSRAAREDRARYYEQLLPGGGLGHRYLYEDYECPTAPLPKAMPLDADSEVLRMERLAPEEMAKVSIEVGAVPGEVHVSQMFWIGVTVKNGAYRMLSASLPFPVNLAYHWIHEATRSMVVFDGQRSEMHPYVQENTTVGFWMSVVAPSLPGKYILQTTMVQEGISWFEDARPEVMQEFVVVVTSK
jgi:hypothetical protein